MQIPPDDGTAEWAAEQAVGFAALAWYRRTHNEGGNGGELALIIAKFARDNVTPAQWRQIGEN